MGMWNLLQRVCKVRLRAPCRVNIDGLAGPAETAETSGTAKTAADYSSGLSCRAAPCVCEPWLPTGPCLQRPANHMSVQKVTVAQAVLGTVDACATAVQCSSPEDVSSHGATGSRASPAGTALCACGRWLPPGPALPGWPSASVQPGGVAPRLSCRCCVPPQPAGSQTAAPHNTRSSWYM